MTGDEAGRPQNIDGKSGLDVRRGASGEARSDNLVGVATRHPALQPIRSIHAESVQSECFTGP